MTSKRAVLIGVDGYAFSPLKSAVNDAIAMRQSLGAISGLGPIVPEADCTILATPAAGITAPAGSIPATRDAILGTLRPYYDEPQPVDLLIVYFAGHGLVASPDGRVRRTVIVPSDVTDPENGRNMISLDELLGLFAERGPRQQLWIVDACRDMPYRRRPRGFEIEWPEQPAQLQRAQAAIFSVAQGGTALSTAGLQGRFTAHLVSGLTGKGSAADYVAARGHCVTVESLHGYARHHVAKGLEEYDDWTRSVQLPQKSISGPPLDPLRDIPPPPARRFTVAVRPPEAETAVDIALQVQAGMSVPTWPPEALPRLYELRAALRPGPQSAGWGDPRPALRAIDLREEDTATIDVPRIGSPLPGPVALPATTGESGIARAETTTRAFAKSLGFAPPRTRLRVDADRVAQIVLQRAEAPWDEMQIQPNEETAIAPGAWNVLIRIGDELIGATRVLLDPGETRVVTAIAQITPATAAVLPPVMIEPGSEPPSSVMPSETIGPMQGAILPTLLPLLALKPFDHDNSILRQFEHLAIPHVSLTAPFPVGVAVAFDGPSSAPNEQLAAYVSDMPPTWIGGEGRLLLFASAVEAPQGTLSIRVGDRNLSIAAPTILGGATAVAVTSWPNGRTDVSVGIFHLPIGSSWPPDLRQVPAGQIARALALAAPLFRAGVNLEEVPHHVVTDVAYAKWLDPVLGALAFHARDRRLEAESKQLHPDFAVHLRSMRDTIRRNMATHFGSLPDSRVIAALDPDPAARRLKLAEVLEDASLGQPALTASVAVLAKAALESDRGEHWSVERLDRIPPGQVFNAIRTD